MLKKLNSFLTKKETIGQYINLFSLISKDFFKNENLVFNSKVVK